MSGTTLHIREFGDAIVIDARGGLALGLGCDSLHRQVQNLVRSGCSRILLLTSSIESVSPADIGELMAGYAAVRAAGGELKLLNPSERVVEALRIAGVDSLFEIETDLEAHRNGQPSHEFRSECYVG